MPARFLKVVLLHPVLHARYKNSVTRRYGEASIGILLGLHQEPHSRLQYTQEGSKTQIPRCDTTHHFRLKYVRGAASGKHGFPRLAEMIMMQSYRCQLFVCSLGPAICSCLPQLQSMTVLACSSFQREGAHGLLSHQPAPQQQSP